jgi:hypothetical protein
MKTLQSVQKLGNFLGNFFITQELPIMSSLKLLTHSRQAEAAKPEAKPYKPASRRFCCF